MASLASTTIFSFFLFLSLAIQPNAARESKFFTKLIHYVSNSPIVSSSSPCTSPGLEPMPAEPSLAPAPAPVSIPGLEPMPAEPSLAPGLAPAPAPAEKEYGYGLYGQGSGEYSSEEYRTSTLDQGFKNENPEYDEVEKWSPPFENSKLLGSNNNGYSNNENVVYSNVNNGYNNNGYSYSNNYNDNGNRFSSSMDENRNGYTTNSYNQNNNDNYNTMRFGNDNNDNEFMSSKERNDAYNNNGYVMKQQGLSDTRFLDNGKYFFDTNNNGKNHETSYEEEVNDNGSQGYYNRNVNEKSKYEFDTMEEYERQQGYPENDPSGYVP